MDISLNSWWILIKQSLPLKSTTLRTYIYYFRSLKKTQKPQRYQFLMATSQIGRNTTTSIHLVLHPSIPDGFSSNKVCRCLLCHRLHVYSTLNDEKRSKNAKCISTSRHIGLHPSIPVGFWSNKACHWILWPWEPMSTILEEPKWPRNHWNKGMFPIRKEQLPKGKCHQLPVAPHPLGQILSCLWIPVPTTSILDA